MREVEVNLDRLQEIFAAIGAQWSIDKGNARLASITMCREWLPIASRFFSTAPYVTCEKGHLRKCQENSPVPNTSSDMTWSFASAWKHTSVSVCEQKTYDLLLP